MLYNRNYEAKAANNLKLYSNAATQFTALYNVSSVADPNQENVPDGIVWVQKLRP
jgi:hypothetical protein